ncbi:MAG: protein kinase [Chloroflexi bacterium]|nr:protein kinase [Chloroflexota bacterium]MBI3740723.1 protein kinase [Chloroflexota bacterium]
MSFALGQNVGPYRIIEQLGQGGMATVFKAYHPALDRYIAIKVLHPAFKEDASFITRFHREARIVAKLDHPNIIPIYDFAEEAGTPYLVIRYVEGKTLKAEQRDALLSLDQVLAIIRPVANALAYAHAQGVLHRDIKPSNIMIANDGHVYLTDFGLARMAKAGESTLSQDMLIGTPQYISPEQAKGEAVSERSDIYSLGVVLFEMLTGRVPFSADTPYSIIHDHIYAPLPLPRSINPNLSAELERVLLKALAKDPAARFGNTPEFLSAFEQAVFQTNPALASMATPVVVLTRASSAATPRPAPTAPPVSIATKTPQPQPKRRALTPLSCAITALVIVFFAIVIGGVSFIARDDLARIFRTGATTSTPGATSVADQIKAARDSVQKNSTDGGAHLRLAELLERNKEYESAFLEYEAAIASNQKLSSGYLRAGALAEKLNELDRAKKYYQAGVNALPDNPELLLQLADVLLQQKQYEDAKKNYDKVIALNPNSALAYVGLGDYYRVTGKPNDAIQQYTRAASIDPNLPEVHFGQGLLAVQFNQIDKARIEFNLVIKSTSASPELKLKAENQLRLLDSKK